MKHEFRELVDRRLSHITWTEAQSREVLRLISEEERPVKKMRLGVVVVVAVLCLSLATALAAGLLWQDAGERVAPMESRNGYYDTWNTDAKVDLVRTLYELNELNGLADVEAVLAGTNMSETEMNILCDSIMTTYLQGTPDTITLLAILEKLHGPMNTWFMEDLVWYNRLLAANDMLSAEDTNYILPQNSELDQQQAIEVAKDFLISKGAVNLDAANVEATMYEESDDLFYGATQISKKGRRVWSIVFRNVNETQCYRTDIESDGYVLSYSIPELDAVYVTGILPEETDISEECAIKKGLKAIAETVEPHHTDEDDIKAFYGYINLGDEEVAHAKLGECVWVIQTGGNYVMISPVGDTVYVGDMTK